MISRHTATPADAWPHTARIVIRVDLSAIIFVVLALAWAVYLIPKALKHHDELASDRLVEGHSDKVRILSRKSSATGVAEVVEVETEHVDTVERVSDLERELAPKPRPRGRHRAAARGRSPAPPPARPRIVAAACSVCWCSPWSSSGRSTWFAYLPIWAPAVPGALVVGWLVLARLSVRKAAAPSPRRLLARLVEDDVEDASSQAAPSRRPRRVRRTSSTCSHEDTTGIPRQEIEAALADDGSLWDPLPMTLPTYVNKARARRTVRTIELTGINSSGHDQADTTLAREAAAESTAGRQGRRRRAQRKAAGA